MPGILPMKVIKVGTSAQARIAQACDRCRSKKIRCDGVRPACTQCVNVGFECKTSDKLSRRAFPRGYTESLEERVRTLEAEVRELKELLDEKDEKIDVLSRLHSHSHSHSPPSVKSPRGASTSTPMPSADRPEEPEDKNDVFKVHQCPVLLDDESNNAYFVGTSSGRTFVDAFKSKLQATGNVVEDASALDAFFKPQPHSRALSKPAQGSTQETAFKAPPRLLSDQLINVFFQEWAPLFPVLHRPTFLTLYEKYVNSPEVVTDSQSLAQLNLVFGIGALSSEEQNKEELASFDSQWTSALEAVLMENSLVTLQCLILAQIYCLMAADYGRLLKYKGLAVSLSYHLGLHQPQKRFSLGALSSETRKKVFWTLYTVDCFSAAHLGLPKLLKEEDIHCEYPVDADDEYVTENGFLPTLPGEYTKLSSALALFRVSRILAKVLAENYPASPSHEISLRKLAALANELEDWSNNLSPHLRLHFVQDKPSTNIISSRSPILSLVYHHIRHLIYRPAVCAGLAERGSSAVIALATSCKHIVQIMQLLEERKLCLSFCINRNELLLLVGFGLLFQALDLVQEGKLLKESQRLVCSVADLLARSNAASASNFRRIGCSVISVQDKKRGTPSLSRHNSEGTMQAPKDAFKSTQKQLKAIASRFSPVMVRQAKPDPRESRRATVADIHHSNHSVTSIRSEPGGTARSEPALSPVSQRCSLDASSGNAPSATTTRNPNLDYLQFGLDLHAAQYGFPNPNVPGGKFPEASSTDWERLLGSLDNGATNIYDTIYGGQPVDALVDAVPLSAGAIEQLSWSPGVFAHPSVESNPPQSVLSFSDESLTSGEEFGACDFPELKGGSGGQDVGSYRGIMIPELSPGGGSGGGGGTTAPSAMGLVSSSMDGQFGM